MGTFEGQGSPGDIKHDPDRRQAVEGEPDFIETNCHWADCERQFDTQDELVRVSVERFLPSSSRLQTIPLFEA